LTGYTASLAQKDNRHRKYQHGGQIPLSSPTPMSIPTTQVAVSKTWVDGGKDHSNDSVTVQLLRNGKAVTGRNLHAYCCKAVDGQYRFCKSAHAQQRLQDQVHLHGGGNRHQSH
jgi:hypothetical protein